MNGPNNAIGWCDYTWNPVTGCYHNCRFGEATCYAETIAKRFAGGKAFPRGFEPTFHPERLKEPQRVKEPARIFVCSMGDLWGAWVESAWVHDVLDAIRQAPWHSFLCLTKAPWHYGLYDLPPNVWAGATVTGAMRRDNERLEAIRDVKASVRFLSCEPLSGLVDPTVAVPDWLIIGAATGRGAFQPEESWAAALEGYARATRIPVFHKDNLRIRNPKRREFPR